MKKSSFAGLLIAFLAVLALGGVLFAFLGTRVHADQCPGSDTCPTSQIAIAQGPNAVEVKWIEPDNLPIVYLLTTNPQGAAQPWQVQVVSPQDWQDRLIFNLQPSTTYTVTICGYYSSSNRSCVTTNSVKTLPPSTGGETPTPTITSANVTTNSIYITWNGNRSYDFYQVLGGQTPQTQTGSGATGSFTFPGLLPGTSYRVEVLGCLYILRSFCSQWASLDVRTALPPPLPPIAPQNLHTADGPSDILVSWTNTPNYESFTSFRFPAWPGGLNLPTTLNSIDDIAPVAGQLYTYKICLNYKSGSACATTTGALPPKCTITFSCPAKVYAPPNYLVQCGGPPVDFYQMSPDGTMSFMLTGTQVSGTSLDYNSFIVVCASGTKTQSSCSSYSIFEGPPDWCAPPPSPPPPPGSNCCIACLKAGGNCNRGPHGCTCY